MDSSWVLDEESAIITISVILRGHLERSKKLMKKERKVAAVVLVALLVFLVGFGLGTSKGISINVKVEGGAAAGSNNSTPVVQPQPQTTQAPPQTTQAPAPAPAPSGDATTAAGADATTAGGAATPAGIPSSTDEIVAKYNEVINNLKHNPGACKLHKTSNTTITVTDAPALKNQINSIVQGLVKPSDVNYTFSGNGSMGTDDSNGGAECDLNNILTPGGKDVALTAAGVANATAAAEGDGYKMAITLVAETSSYDGTNTVNPVHHESCLTPLNLATLDIKPAQITSANMEYSGATLNVTVDGQGRVTHYDFKLPMKGSGSGKLGLSINVGLEGEMTEVYDFTY